MNLIREQKNRENERGAREKIKKEQGDRPKIRREQGARTPLGDPQIRDRS